MVITTTFTTAGIKGRVLHMSPTDMHPCHSVSNAIYFLRLFMAQAKQRAAVQGFAALQKP